VQSNSFETYAELFLSESRSSEVMLPELHGTDSDRVFASDTWRVTVSNQLVDRTTGSVVSVEQITESRFFKLLTHTLFSVVLMFLQIALLVSKSTCLSMGPFDVKLLVERHIKPY